MEMTVRYDELKVRYPNEHTALLKNNAGDEIYLPASVINQQNKSEWLPLNMGEKNKITWKDYLVDETHYVSGLGLMGWVWYYPTNYKRNGFYYKIRADLYYEGQVMCPEVSVANDMADAFYNNLKKNSQYKDKVYYNKAPNSKLINIGRATSIRGSDIEIKPLAIWLKTGTYVEMRNVETWIQEYPEYTKHMHVYLECLIENQLCFIQMKHVKIKS